ncbi:MAG: hypothetical protein GY822_11365 [Deltaproteobacteria bacterium]|nr:hypothetical protein [Deltaproteobacteria bacterium]
MFGGEELITPMLIWPVRPLVCAVPYNYNEKSLPLFCFGEHCSEAEVLPGRLRGKPIMNYDNETTNAPGGFISANHGERQNSNLKSAAHVSRRREAEIYVALDEVKLGALITSNCIACAQREADASSRFAFFHVSKPYLLFVAAFYGGLLILSQNGLCDH